MPDRIVRAGILTSDGVNSLSWAAEVFYRRLMSVVDDFGRYDGRNSVLRGALYSLKLDRVSDSDIGKWIRECEEAGLVRRYTVESKPFLELAKFGQKIRAKHSKWPNPPTLANTCQHVSANAPVVVSVVVSEDVGDIGSRDQSRSPEPVNGDAVIYVPLNDGTEFGVSKELADELAKLYPAVDVPQTLNEIRAWNLTNKSQRKTRSGILKHINTWCAKEQNRG